MATPFTVELSMPEPPSEAQARAVESLGGATPTSSP
jgi:hypothetical protein